MKVMSFSFNKKYLTRKEMISIIEKVTGKTGDEITIVVWKERKKRKKHTITVIVEY